MLSRKRKKQNNSDKDNKLRNIDLIFFIICDKKTKKFYQGKYVCFSNGAKYIKYHCSIDKKIRKNIRKLSKVKNLITYFYDDIIHNL